MGCCASSYPSLERVDLDNPSPLENESKTYDEVKQLLDERHKVFEAIEGYEGCQELARAAMSNPSRETELAAFEGLLKAVDSIALFHKFSQKMEPIFQKLLKRLSTCVTVADKLCHLDQMPGLTQQLADIFDFALKFDQVRMLRPNLSNDFSYYRRLLPKFNKHKDIKVKDDEASGMALFTAEHIPMTSCLAKAGAKAQELLVIDDGKAAEGTIGCVLSTMANTCYNMLKADNVKNVVIARAMTGSVVIFDYVDPDGTFHKRSPVAIKGIIQLIKRDYESSMLNAIRYSTRNFRDAPESIQAMFD